MLITVCDCVRCAVGRVQCAAVRHSNSCNVLQCAAKLTAVFCSAAVCAAVCGSVWLSGSAHGSVRLSSGAAVFGSPAVSMFSNKFKTY
jgi:hypothetical protein